MKSEKAEQLQREIDANNVARGACDSRAATKEAAEIMAGQARRSAERVAKFRAGKRSAGLVEIRGIFAKAENHRAVKCFADALEIGFIRAIKKKKGEK